MVKQGVLDEVDMLNSGRASAAVMTDAVFGLVGEVTGLPKALDLGEQDAASYRTQAFNKHYGAE